MRKMIVFALVGAAGAGSIVAASFDAPLLSLLSLHHGQHDPEHVEKDLIQDKVVDVSLRPVDVAGLGEPVAILCGRWGSHHMDARNENDRFLVLGYTAARDRSFQFEIGAARQPGRSAGFSASAQPSSADGP